MMLIRIISDCLSNSSSTETCTYSVLQEFVLRNTLDTLIQCTSMLVMFITIWGPIFKKS